MEEERFTDVVAGNDFMGRLLAGAISGFAATAPMSAAMELMHRRLPWYERYPLPPSQIVTKVTQELGLRKHMDSSDHLATTLLVHFGYGAGVGAVYGPLFSRVPLPGAVKGIVFGLCVWGASYLGLLPGLGILRPATEHPVRRSLLMIAAHIVWGAALGMLVERLQPEDEADDFKE